MVSATALDGTAPAAAALPGDLPPHVREALANGAAGRLELTVSDGRLALFADGRTLGGTLSADLNPHPVYRVRRAGLIAVGFL